MNLSLRDDGKNMGCNAAKDGPAAFMGIQQIPDNTVLKNGKDGENYNVNDHYGGGRIRLNPPSGNLVADGESTTDRGFYLHGRDKWLDETHGCICNRSLEVFNYFWSGAGKDTRGAVPFSVEEEK